MLRGNYLATVDEKGRMKIPADFLALLRKTGKKFYVTSETGGMARIYPMKSWEKIEEKLAKVSTHNRAKQKFLARVNYYGQVVELDGQGRILIPPTLRESAQMKGEVDVQGQLTYLEVWNTPVLVEEVLNWLRIRPEGTYVDATVGTGGHAIEIARRLTTGRLVGMDRDPRALEIARERLGPHERQVTLVHAEFSKIGEVAENLKLPPLDGVLADLGISSLELDTPERGFSFRWAAPLDMRMNPDSPLTAEEIVNFWPEKELAYLLYKNAEERDSRRIARAIVRARPIRDTEHLATVVAGGRKARGRQRLHPATKTFLALRTAVNREEEELGQFLSRTPATLAQGGRMIVLSYHSLEDRMVKHEFQRLAREKSFRVLTKKVILPGDEEIRNNPRSRSAKMRVAEKVATAESSAPEAWS
jgi:16S rRNA (cytosine1402-N4)-methyltransferase